MAKVPVAADAHTKSYYKYYENMEIANLTPEQMEYIANCKGDPADALQIADRNRLLDDDYIPEPHGFYELPTGGLLVSGTIPMPDVTYDMLNWWWPWHALEPLRYAIWDPEDHFDSKIPDEARARILDPNVPIPEKIWGCDNTVLESIGGPADDIVIMFKNPGELGYDMSKIGPGKREFFLAANALMGSMKVPVVMTETAKEIDGVMTFMARFWVGYHIIDGEARYLLPPEVKLPEQVAMGLAAHNIKEFQHLNKILPLVYAEEKDNW